MRTSHTALIEQDGPWWIGWIEEIPSVDAQETTREELVESLQEALGEAIEFNRQEARAAAGSGYEELAIAL